MPECILKFQLAVIATVCGISERGSNISLSVNVLPECSIVKLAAKSLAGCVVDILYVGKNSDFIHGRLSQGAVCFIADALSLVS